MVVKPPKRYVYTDLIAYALIAAYEVSTKEQRLIVRLLKILIQTIGMYLWMRK